MATASVRYCVFALGVVLVCWNAARVQAAETAKTEILPRNSQLAAPALGAIIDQEIHKRLEADHIKLAPRSDDAEFLRRACLDLIGVIPTAEKVTRFLDNPDSGKRARVIDELLDDRRFGTHLAETWSGLLLPRESNNRRLDHKPLQQWLADGFNTGKPLDKLVYELVTATGNQDQNGAVTYFIYNPTVDKITDSVTHMFLGVRLQCAQCHNHPFVDIKQTDYWGMAAFFTKVRLTGNPKKAAKAGTTIGVAETGQPARGKKAALPQSAKVVPAKFFHDAQPKIGLREPARPVLARWLTSTTNPYFAKAMVNRTWYHLFGRGIVNPVDDMHEGNVPSHPELLATLTEQFKSSGFDLKYLYRAICNSEAYQRTSRTSADSKDDGELYSRAAVRALSPEQLYDSLTLVLGAPAKQKPNKAKKQLQAKRGPGGPREAFLNFFRIEEGANPLEYQAGIPQALRLMNSPQTSGNALLATLMRKQSNPAQAVEHLYLTVLSRRPTRQEVQRMTEYIGRQETPRAGCSDVLWALLNSSEFALNH